VDDSTAWAKELRAVIAAADETTRLLSGLRDWTCKQVLADDVLPKELPEPASSLFASLDE
jgi:hypothetical protein